MLPSLRYIMTQKMQSPLLKEICNDLDPLEDLCELEERDYGRNLIAMKEGGIIKDGS